MTSPTFSPECRGQLVTRWSENGQDADVKRELCTAERRTMLAEIERLTALVQVQGKRNLELAGSVREQMLPFIEIARREALEEAARFVSAASVSHPSPLDGIGSTDLRDMNETARIAIHAACQSLAFELRALAAKEGGGNG